MQSNFVVTSHKNDVSGRAVVPTRSSRKKGVQATVLPFGADIEVRKMNLSEIEDSPIYFFDNDPATSHFFHMLSLLFPEGELFFIESVRNFRDRVTDPVLKKQVKAFIGQEVLHTKAHVDYNRRLRGAGVDIERLDQWLGVAFGLVKKYVPEKDQLALTCMAEHFTATLAEEVLRNEEIQKNIHPSQRSMWLWHAIEETEHKAVAFDVFRAIGGGDVRRLAVVPVAAAAFAPVGLGVMIYVMGSDGQLLNFKSWRRLGRNLFNRRTGLLRRTAARLLEYGRPGFHPWQHDSYDLVSAWKARFAEQYKVA